MALLFLKPKLQFPTREARVVKPGYTITHVCVNVKLDNNGSRKWALYCVMYRALSNLCKIK